MRDIVYLNGDYVERAEAKVSVEDRGYQFGDGVYEVVRFHGRRGLRLDDHLERLINSSNQLRIKGVHSPDQWREIITRLVELTELPDDPDITHTLYQQVTRGDFPRTHLFPKQPVSPTSVAYFRAAPVYTAEKRASGIALAAQPDERWQRCYIKAVCLLPVVLAKQTAVDQGAFEALLVRDGIVTEGASTNAFCIIGGAVHTHPEGGHILSGVTRHMLFEAAENVGVQVVERAVPLKEFRRADEAFITSTTMDIMPATSLDGHPIGSGEVGSVTKKLAESLAKIVQREVRGN